LMSMLDKLFRDEIDKLIAKQMKDHVLALDDLRQHYQDKTKKLAEEIESVRMLFDSISNVVAIFDVEAVLDLITEDTRQRLMAEAPRIAAERQIGMRVGRDILPLELPAMLEVYHSCVYYLIGVKFIEGDGYGQYAIWDGRKTILRQTFTRSKNGGEIGVVFRPLRFEADAILSIGPFLGNETGRLSISMIGLSARPTHIPSAIRRISED